jgi:hypothetical protein
MPSSLVFAPAWLGVAAHMSRSVIRDGGFFGSSHVDSPGDRRPTSSVPLNGPRIFSYSRGSAQMSKAKQPLLP